MCEIFKVQFLPVMNKEIVLYFILYLSFLYYIFFHTASILIHLVNTATPQAANKKVIEYRLSRNTHTTHMYMYVECVE